MAASKQQYISMDLLDRTDYEAKRQALLPAANTVFLASHMHGLLSSYLEAYPEHKTIDKIPDKIARKAYIAAQEIADTYLELYKEKVKERAYHGPRHRIQLLPKWVAGGIEANKSKLEVTTYENVREICLNPNKALGINIEQNGMKIPDMFEFIRAIDYHDCLYVLGETQTKLVEGYLAQKDSILVPGTSIPLAKLMDVCYGADGKKRVINVKTEGYNEYASLAHALKISQDIARKYPEFPSFNTATTTKITEYLGATIPFQGDEKPNRYLNNMASNLIKFIQETPELRTALAADINKAGGLEKFVYSTTRMAGILGNCDVSQFDAEIGDALRGDDLVVAEDASKISYKSKNPFDVVNRGIKGFNKYSPDAVRKSLGLTGDYDGYIDRRTVFHSFDVPGYSISSDKRNADFKSINSPQLAVGHGRNMLFALLQLAEIENGVSPKFWANKTRYDVSDEMLEKFLPVRFDGKEVVETRADTKLLLCAIQTLRNKTSFLPPVTYSGLDTKESVAKDVSTVKDNVAKYKADQAAFKATFNQEFVKQFTSMALGKPFETGVVVSTDNKLQDPFSTKVGGKRSSVLGNLPAPLDPKTDVPKIDYRHKRGSLIDPDVKRKLEKEFGIGKKTGVIEVS